MADQQHDIDPEKLESHGQDSKHAYDVEVSEVSPAYPPTREGRPWRTGHKERFPIVSFWCLMGVIVLCLGSIVILFISDHKDVSSWCSGHVKIGHFKRSARMTVSVWISLITFLAGQLLAIVFTEGIAVSWWVGAMKGKTLNRLHHDWAAGQSVAQAVSKPRLLSWVCVASVAYTAFSALGTVLQKASTASTVPSFYTSNMTSSLAGAIPAGYSGIFAAVGHDDPSVTYLTSEFTNVLQNYTSKVDISIKVDGCPPTANVSCSTLLTGVGFHYSCAAGRKNLADPLPPGSSNVAPTQTVFNTDFDWVWTDPWHIGMSTLWKDSTDPSGSVITTRTCRLVPALVKYPVNVSRGIVTLLPAKSPISWTTAPAQEKERLLLVDEVIKELQVPDFDARQTVYVNLSAGSKSTLGGFWFTFSSLFKSTITTQYDMTNSGGGDIGVTGSFAVPFAVFPQGTDNDDLTHTTYSSPMDQLLANIREIMFRTSVAVVEHNITDLTWDTTAGPYGAGAQVLTSHCPNLTSTTAGTYRMFHTVYHTSMVWLGIAIGLMALVLCAILPLFWGYWRLGRKVSFSPLEMAKALHQPANMEINGAQQHVSVLDVNTRAGGGQRLVGSNYRSEDLVRLIGDIKVRYGEVEPNVMGLGPMEHTGTLQGGTTYH